MSTRNKRLGRGLRSLSIDTTDPAPMPSAGRTDSLMPRDSLIPDKGLSVTTTIPLHTIRANPNQPRRDMSHEGIKSLSESIKINGLIQPIVVRVKHNREESENRDFFYEIIAGERRWRAAQEAGLAHVPAIIRDADDEQVLALALIENIHREDLNAIDRSIAYQQLRTQYGWSVEELATRVGEDRTTVTNYLRLLDLPQQLQEMVSQELLSMGHARSLLGIRGDQELQLKLAKSVITNDISVRALEQLVRRHRDTELPDNKPPAHHKAKRAHICDLEERFTHALQTPVTIREGAKPNRGKVIIAYRSLDDFDRIMERLGISD